MQPSGSAKVKCQYCEKLFTRRGVKVHERQCPNIDGLADVGNKYRKRQIKAREMAKAQKAKQKPIVFTPAPWESRPLPELSQKPSTSTDIQNVQSESSDDSLSILSSESATDIRIEYHPNSSRPTVEIPLLEFRKPQPASPPPPTSPQSDTFSPFKTESEFLFAEIALEASLTKTHVSKICDIINKCVSGKDSFGLKSAADLERCLVNAGNLVPKFEKYNMTSAIGKLTMDYDFRVSVTPKVNWLSFLLVLPVLVSPSRSGYSFVVFFV
ncbi:hypothetical protein AGABI2DRAFT_146790 [Agaricus bisporus var. bisporus H97]|uniref:hypothetical protein n=1 Tax=Agaricus bisporus var. bisporus (strain H97 / ATCC MYA-4626 / FGSC 10389) TaxID=936046 RepID=UPI00029F6FA0|nr:hypothetical protein AGABI2DRAFT_146790 [Agaricus bisporus var. bisporus H97]EKV42326.1 hypothetical protein AGABI2DRAFT_146790 [Agaricus bisporus var. bisporus H97]